MALLKGDRDKANALDAATLELENRQIALAGKKAELQAASNELINKSIDDRLKSDRMLQAAQKITTQVGDRLGNSLQDLFRAMREGTLTADNFKQGVKDLFLGILEDVQTTLLEETVINPMKDFLTEKIGGLFNFGTGAADPAETTAEATAVKIPDAISQQTDTICSCLRELSSKSEGGIPGQSRGRGGGIDSAAFKNLGREQPAMLGAGKADPVRDIMAANEALAGQTGNIAGEMDEFGDTGLSVIDEFDVSMTDFGKGGVNSINSLGTSFSSFADTALNSLFSMKTLAMGIGAGIGGMIGGPGGAVAGAVIGAVAEPLIKGVGSAILGGFGFAGGGYVRKMAAGGMMRDRVPAMLEPGEFVMQRKAVNRIGAQNLSAMNGTGNGMPNISVEVKNEGSPKDAQAQVKPQMDVNKMVVEIVTRDIRNNGPIRKTLRTGAE